MEKTLSASEVQRDFGEVLQGVISNDDKVVIELQGVPVAVLVPMEVYRQWQRGRKEAFDKLREISELASQRANLIEEEADELAAEAVRWARSHKDE